MNRELKQIKDHLADTAENCWPNGMTGRKKR